MAGSVGRLFDRFFSFRLTPHQTGRHAGPIVRRLGPPDCEMAVVEFDDQGLPFTRHSINELQAALDRLTGRNPIIIVFAHGWKHSGAAGDSNLDLFKDRVEETADREHNGGSGRPVLGVYLAWRGLSRDGNWLWTQSSFWDRRQAAQRVAAGSARELLGRLKAFRNGRPGDRGPHATLVVIGHSFGGLVVYSAIAQSLIEAAATQEEVTPSFGDLVVLVNPAFSAVSYLPIHDLIQDRNFKPGRLPVCVAITAENDWATGYAYPFGSLTRLLTEAWRTLRQREALIRTMGHLPWMQTHRLSAALPAPAPHAAAGTEAPLQGTGGGALCTLSAPGAADTVGPVAVRHLSGRSYSPFWVASAAKEVVDGHNDIGNPLLLGFLRELVAMHVAAEPKRPAKAPEPVS